MYQQHLYKQQLYNTLSNDHNLVDNVKLQLREKIINKLKTTQKITTDIQPQKDFIKKICVSLFSQFLTSQRLFHTLAVFSPQSGVSRQVLKAQQLRQLLKVNQQDKTISTLEQIIKKYLPKGRLMQRTVQTSCQTDDKQTIQNLQNKLAHIEFQFKQKAVDGLKTVQDSQQRFLKYKNQLNQRYKQQLQQEIKRIRDFQISKVKLQEQQKNRIKTRQYEEDLQINYQIKLQKLRQREAEVMTRVTNKMKEVETYNYQARQRMLKDFQSIKARQQELERLKQQLLQQQRNNAGK